jgi:hypothetical protein
MAFQSSCLVRPGDFRMVARSGLKLSPADRVLNESFSSPVCQPDGRAPICADMVTTALPVAAWSGALSVVVMAARSIFISALLRSRGYAVTRKVVLNTLEGS